MEGGWTGDLVWVEVSEAGLWVQAPVDSREGREGRKRAPPLA